MNKIDPQRKAEIIRLHIQDGRTYKSLSDEYGYPASTISRWVRQYRQAAEDDNELAQSLAIMEKIRRLQKENQELRKEQDFLKKSAGILRKEEQESCYRFIDKYAEQFGTNWLFERLQVYPNAYYNYQKHRKDASNKRKASTLKRIEQLYREYNGKPGYRMMQKLLEAEGILLSVQTVRKYMNVELGLKSV
ncbi:MAG: transposase, partial [Eubacterium sp.]